MSDMGIVADGYDGFNDEAELAAGATVDLSLWTSEFRLKQKEVLEDLCRSLRENTPDLTDVDMTHTYTPSDEDSSVYMQSPRQRCESTPYPLDYSGTLGEALQGSTHVRSLKLDVPVLIAYKRVHFALQHYIRTNTGLRKVCLSRSYGYDGLNRFADPARVTQTLLEAVASNVNIHELELENFVSSRALA